MISTRSLIAVALAVAGYVVDIPRVAFSQPQTATGQPELCELKIEGHAILNLTVLGDDSQLGHNAGGLAGQRFERPAKSLWLPAGRYRVTDVKLEGGCEFADDFARGEGWFELEPGKSHQLEIGAPLSPQVSVTRHGKFLEMNYDLVDAAGRSYTWSSGQQPAPPQFTVYKNDEVLGSGSFEYG